MNHVLKGHNMIITMGEPEPAQAKISISWLTLATIYDQYDEDGRHATE